MVAQLSGTPQARTGLFDTHLSDADRFRATDASRADGILVGGDRPAASLFRDFEALGARATRHHYSHDLGLDVDALTFIPQPGSRGYATAFNLVSAALPHALQGERFLAAAGMLSHLQPQQRPVGDRLQQVFVKLEQCVARIHGSLGMHRALRR